MTTVPRKCCLRSVSITHTHTQTNKHTNTHTHADTHSSDQNIYHTDGWVRVGNRGLQFPPSRNNSPFSVSGQRAVLTIYDYYIIMIIIIQYNIVIMCVQDIHDNGLYKNMTLWHPSCKIVEYFIVFQWASKSRAKPYAGGEKRVRDVPTCSLTR